MIMATEKRKSVGGTPGTPAKFAKKDHGKSPQNQKGGNTPKFNQQKKGFQQKQQSPKPTTPPPPPKDAKALKIEVKQELQKMSQQKQKQGGGKPNKQKGKEGKANGALNKVSDKSRSIKKAHHKRMSGQKRLYAQLDAKPRNKTECERALKAEKEFGHNGRVYTIRLPDPVVTLDVVKSWSGTIETAVFPKPVEPRQFYVVFKNNANAKKEVENLKKITFGGGKLQVEERFEAESDKIVDQIDPYALYLSNLHENVTKDELQKLFSKATQVSPPKKHGPRVKTATKFAFVVFDNADDAIAAFKEHYTSALHGNTMVMRFRRITPSQLHKQKALDKKASEVANKTEATKKTEAKATPAKKAEQAKAKAQTPKKELKKEPESDEDDEDDDEEEDDDETGLKVEMDEDDDDDDDDDEEEEDDDEDDDLEEEEDDDDDDDDE